MDAAGDATAEATERGRATGLTAAQGTVRTEDRGAHLGTARYMRRDARATAEAQLCAHEGTCPAACRGARVLRAPSGGGERRRAGGSRQRTEMACRVLVSIVIVAVLVCDALALRTSRAASIDFSRYPVQTNVRVVLVGTAPRHQLPSVNRADAEQASTAMARWAGASISRC